MLSRGVDSGSGAVMMFCASRVRRSRLTNTRSIDVRYLLAAGEIWRMEIKKDGTESDSRLHTRVLLPSTSLRQTKSTVNVVSSM